jgi:hypothetical protein
LKSMKTTLDPNTIAYQSQKLKVRAVRAIEAIGLSELAGRLREVARLTGADLDEWQAGLGQRVLEGAVIRAGGLKDHARGLPADPDDEGLVASLIIGETTGGSIAQAMNIEVVFRDVNADGRRIHLFRASACFPRLCLSFGAPPLYPFRPKEKTRAIQL